MSNEYNDASYPPGLLDVQEDGFGYFEAEGALGALKAVWPELNFGSAKTWLASPKEVNINLVTVEAACVPSDKTEKAPLEDEQMKGLVKEARENRRLRRPILVRKISTKYQVIAGRMQLQAAKLAGLEKIDIYVIDVDEEEPRSCIKRGTTYQRELVVGSDTDDWSVGLCLVPTLTPWGTFIVRGKEYAMLTELVRGPGIYFKFDSEGRFENARIVPLKKGTCGFQPEIKIEKKKDGLVASASSIFKDMPIEELIQKLKLITQAAEEEGGADKDEDKREDKIRAFLKGFNLGEAGRRSLKVRIKSEATSEALQLEDLEKIRDLNKPAFQKKLEEIPEEQRLILTNNDSLEWKIAKRSGDFLEDALIKTFTGLKNSISGKQKDKLVSSKDGASQEDLKTVAERLCDQYNGRISRSVCSQFTGNSLLQLLDQENPLSELEQKRRLSAVGPDGLSGDHISDSVRAVHRSHYGRICPVETPEGQKVGITLSLARQARVNGGQLETPYHKWMGGDFQEDVEWLSAAEEAEPPTRQSSEMKKFVPFAEDGRIAMEEGKDRTLCRSEGDLYGVHDLGKGVQFGEGFYMDASKGQIFSVATSLIPYVEHDDAHRALMGSNMQRQAIPLDKPQAPYVQTGIEVEVASQSRDIPVAEAEGKVKYVDSEKIEICYEGGDTRSYALDVFERTNKGGSRTLRPLVKTGDSVEQGTVLADGYATQGGKLALGANLLAAYMCWEGYNYEDGIVLSQRVLDENLLTSTHIDEIRIEVRKNEVERVKRRVKVGQHVHPGSVLVEKRVPGPARSGSDAFLALCRYVEDEKEVPSEKYIKKLSGKPTTERAPEGFEGTVIAVESDKERGCKLFSGVSDVITVRIARERKVEIGDKLAGRHGNKGVICKILPAYEMPFLADGTPVDIVLNPLGVPSRLNVGQLFECATGWAARWGCDSEHKPEIGKEPEPISISCPPFDGPSKKDLDGYIKDAGEVIEGCRSEGFRPLMEDGKVDLYDGHTGEKFEGKIAVGYAYMMKLDHMVQDKVHARAQGPYSIIENQPLKGRSRGGGQRIGDMETWSLGAYGANNLLNEMFTEQSDQLGGRKNLWSSLSGKTDAAAAESALPETTRVLLMYLRALCLDWGDEEEMEALIGQLRSLDEEIGLDAGFSIKFAAPEAVVGWSKGEVKKAALWNFSPAKKDKNEDGEEIPGPMEEGLIDPKIFGRENSEDGSWKSNFGHIVLEKPVTHPWCKKTARGYDQKIGSLPVLPAGLRPAGEQPGGTYSASDLNVLYRDVIIWNGVLGDIVNMEKAKNVSEYVIRELEDKALDRLQLAVDQLLMNGDLDGQNEDFHVQNQKLNKKGKPYKSLTDHISGKLGVIRKSLLAKRVDFSGRSVIVTDPKLNFDECLLPYEMAVRLFKPQLLRAWQDETGEKSKVKDSLIKENEDESREKLEEILGESLVLLNRTPTLHRPSIQAFKPKLAPKGRKAIGLHPLACSAFNADFDGDTMAVFVPMGDGSKEEVEKMLASNNIFSPGTGEPLAKPTQDMIIGIYWKTQNDKGIEELVGELKKVDGAIENLFAPSEHWWGKKTIGRLVADICELYRQEERQVSEAAPVLNKLMELGFGYAKESCLTVSYSDLFPSGTDTEEELEQRLGSLGDDRISSTPILAMTDSGARGNKKHTKQILVSRGEMQGSEGETMDLPIEHSLAVGMDPLEYWLSVYGSRKDVMNTALGTAKSGTFARALVNAVQDVRITKDDCGTSEGRKVYLKPDEETKEFVADKYSWLVGRYRICDGKSEMIESIKQIEELYKPEEGKDGVCEIVLRSPMFCKETQGVCQHCYGWDLTSRKDAEIGAAVGIVAAQSMSEPATQMTLSTFHGGGAAGAKITEGLPYIKELMNHPEKHLKAISEGGGTASAISFAEEIEKAYKAQGADVDSKHIELVVGAMINCKEVGTTVKIPAGFVLTQNFVVGDVLTEETAIATKYSDICGTIVNCKVKGDKISVEINTGAGKNPKKTRSITNGHVGFAENVKKGNAIKEGDPLFVLKGAGPIVAVSSAGDKSAFVRYRDAKIRGYDGARGYDSLSKNPASGSFLAAASVADARSVLTEAALNKTVDRLTGFKERLIFGLPVYEPRRQQEIIEGSE